MARNTNTATAAAPRTPEIEDTDEFRRGADISGPSKTMTREEILELAGQMADQVREVALGFFSGVLIRSSEANRAYVMVDFLSQLANERNFAIRRHINGMPPERQAACLGFLGDHIREARNLAGRHVKYLPVPQTTGQRAQQPVGDETTVNG